MTEARFETQSWKVGAATITSVVEDQTELPPGLLFPEATEEMVQRHPWLVPDWADAAGGISLRTQAFVVEIDGLTVLVDPCVGNGKVRWLPVWNDLDLPFLERFADAGFSPGAVRARRCTPTCTPITSVGTRHREGDTWVPTFTACPPPLHPGRARLRAHVGAARRRRVRRLDRADHRRRPRRRDRARHRPRARHAARVDARSHAGSPSLWIESNGEHALITGDFMHHPLQFAEPQVAEIADADVEVARATRTRMMREMARTGALVLGTHFPTARPGGSWSTATSGGSSPSSATAGQSMRCMSTTSSQRPNLRPTSRSAPI